MRGVMRGVMLDARCVPSHKPHGPPGRRKHLPDLVADDVEGVDLGCPP